MGDRTSELLGLVAFRVMVVFKNIVLFRAMVWVRKRPYAIRRNKHTSIPSLGMGLFSYQKKGGLAEGILHRPAKPRYATQELFHRNKAKALRVRLPCPPPKKYS